MMDDLTIDFDEPVPDLLTYWANQREASAARRKPEITPGSKGMARVHGELDEDRIFHEVSARRIPARSMLVRAPRKSIYDPIEDKRPARLRLGVDKEVLFGPPIFEQLDAKKELSARDIATTVGRARGFGFKEILSIRRFGPLVEARQECIFFAWAMTSLSLPQIGRAFGKDHTTVLHAVRKVCKQKGLDYGNRVACCDSAKESYQTLQLQAAGNCIDLPHAGSWLGRGRAN